VTLANVANNGGFKITAVSGTQLLPKLNIEGPGPDAGPKPTTRIAIGYNKSKDNLYILEGGTYKGGFTRDDLRNVMNALGATDEALELDGGGSAAFVVDNNKVRWTGADPSPSACPDLGNAYCTPDYPNQWYPPAQTRAGLGLTLIN